MYNVDGWNGRAKDIKGNKYGKLTAVRPIKKDNTNSWVWLCTCECGNTKEARVRDLTSGHTISCGCFKTDDLPQKMVDGNNFIDGTCTGYLTQKLRSDNKTGIKGVHYSKSRNKYVAQIQFKGKMYGLGRYDTLEEATKIRKTAEEKLFGEFLEWYKDNYTKQERGSTDGLE